MLKTSYVIAELIHVMSLQLHNSVLHFFYGCSLHNRYTNETKTNKIIPTFIARANNIRYIRIIQHRLGIPIKKYARHLLNDLPSAHLSLK